MTLIPDRVGLGVTLYQAEARGAAAERKRIGTAVEEAYAHGLEVGRELGRREGEHRAAEALLDESNRQRADSYFKGRLDSVSDATARLACLVDPKVAELIRTLLGPVPEGADDAK